MKEYSHRIRNDGANPMGGPSFEVMQVGRAIDRSTVRRSIDLGGGTGRNSFYLAGEGFEATLVECNSSLCSDARSLMTSFGLSLNIVEGDVAQFEGEGRYDIVLLLGILHFLDEVDAVGVIERFKRKTTAGGVHLITIAPKLVSDQDVNSLLAQGYLGSVSRARIDQVYQDWTLLAYERYRKTDNHLTGDVDTHAIEKFVFAPAGCGKLGWSVRSINLFPKGKLDGLTAELGVALSRRDGYEDFERRYGSADSVLSVSANSNNISLMGPCNNVFELSVAFWGRVKCYFENGQLTGFAKYETDRFHVFDRPNGALPKA